MQIGENEINIYCIYVIDDEIGGHFYLISTNPEIANNSSIYLNFDASRKSCTYLFMNCLIKKKCRNIIITQKIRVAAFSKNSGKDQI